MAKRVGVDKWLFGVVLLLVLFGLVMVFSASAVIAKVSNDVDHESDDEAPAAMVRWTGVPGRTVDQSSVKESNG